MALCPRTRRIGPTSQESPRLGVPLSMGRLAHLPTHGDLRFRPRRAQAPPAIRSPVCDDPSWLGVKSARGSTRLGVGAARRRPTEPWAIRTLRAPLERLGGDERPSGRRSLAHCPQLGRWRGSNYRRGLRPAVPLSDHGAEPIHSRSCSRRIFEAEGALVRAQRPRAATTLRRCSARLKIECGAPVGSTLLLPGAGTAWQV
jgi:hypothetical protein